MKTTCFKIIIKKKKTTQTLLWACKLLQGSVLAEPSQSEMDSLTNSKHLLTRPWWEAAGQMRPKHGCLTACGCKAPPTAL